MLSQNSALVPKHVLRKIQIAPWPKVASGCMHLAGAGEAPCQGAGAVWTQVAADVVRKALHTEAAQSANRFEAFTAPLSGKLPQSSAEGRHPTPHVRTFRSILEAPKPRSPEASKLRSFEAVLSSAALQEVVADLWNVTGAPAGPGSIDSGVSPAPSPACSGTVVQLAQGPQSERMPRAAPLAASSERLCCVLRRRDRSELVSRFMGLKAILAHRFVVSSALDPD